MWRRPVQIRQVLSAPDVTVTNQGDKDTQLAKIATLDGKPLAKDTVSTFGMTAFLNVNYRAPCHAGTTVVIRCVVEKEEVGEEIDDAIGGRGGHPAARAQGGTRPGSRDRAGR